MSKLVIKKISIMCLLFLITANTIATAIQAETGIVVVWNEEGECNGQNNSLPVEEDPNETDDENSKLIFPYLWSIGSRPSSSNVYPAQLLTSFHFLEIISPPPQA
jgi:hypothetical protein